VTPQKSKLRAVPLTALAVLGAHSGAGATTVAGLLGLNERDGATGTCELEPGQALPHGANPVLVARTTAAGTRAAAELIAGWHPGVARPWLVLVADAPAPAPSPVRYRARALGGQVRGVAWVPWLWPLRAADRLIEVATTRSVRSAARGLRAALDKEQR
jgi:hypothetical protein